MKKDLLTSFVVVELSKFLEIVVCMHSINAVFLIGDTILNCMVSSTFLYSPNGYVIQTPMWPYPFLDLSSSYAPLWYTFNLLLDIIMIYVHDVRREYLGIGVMLIPCYGIFALIVKLKDFSLSRTFRDSYRKLR
ncbi:hypothetical protein Goarm_009949 [Gossypium armourianum]|uniref:Uncharacterized protein n=1 Tax=Gossypium armourianum TaxID=34283 RepID=A0A7J9JUH0_9ROSI|nr:hypothetical protein [Gossypium armourianum]